MKKYLETIANCNKDLLKNISSGAVSKALDILYKCFNNNHILLACGNGGSATMAQHFVAELVGKFGDKMNYLPAIDLVSGTGIVTSLANDCGYENIFKNQIMALGKTGDVLFCMSTSGTSTNILEGIDEAQDRGMKTIYLTGAYCPISCDVILYCSSFNTQRVQEIHLTLCHILVELLQTKFE